MFSHWTVCITNCILVTSDYSKKLTSRLDRIGSDMTCTFRKKSLKKVQFKLLKVPKKSWIWISTTVLGGGAGVFLKQLSSKLQMSFSTSAWYVCTRTWSDCVSPVNISILKGAVSRDLYARYFCKMNPHELLFDKPKYFRI